MCTLKTTTISLLIATILLNGCAGLPTGDNPQLTQGLPPDPDPNQVQAAYRLGPGDLVQVQVFRVPELNLQTRVNDTGSILLPLVGTVQVAGLTPEQASAHLARALDRYVNQPQVHIQVLESANLKVTVTGAVAKPTVLPLRGEMTLLQALAQAQGFNDLARPQAVVIFRQVPGDTQPRGYVVDVNRIQRGELPDPRLAVNDKIVVPESGTQRALRNVFGTIRGVVSVSPL